MRALNVTNTAVDLAAQNVPFLSNYTLAAINGTAGSLTLQESDEDDGGWTTLATIAAGACAEVTPLKQYIRVSTSATIALLGV